MASSLVRDGLRVHYDVAGSGEVGALFAHGLTGTGAADWRLMLPELTPHYRCVVPDMRGHGRSDYRAAGFGVDAMGEDVRALIAHEQMERPHLVGFSMGAELLLSLELETPGTARALVLIGPSTGCPPDRGGYGEITGDAPSFWPKLLRRLHDEHHGPDHWRTLFRHIAGSWGRHARSGLSKFINERTRRRPIVIPVVMEV